MDRREIIADVAQNVNTSKISSDAEFQESGLDSLDQASILLAIRERYDIDFPDDVGSEMTCIRAIVDYAATAR